MLGAAAAGAEPPGWTTVPDSGGSYGWEVPTPARAQAPTPAPPPPSSGAQVVTSSTPVAATPKPKPRRAHRVRAHSRRRQQPPVRRELIVKPQRTGAVLAADATESRAMYSALLVAALLAAIACFATGATPTTQIRWRRGAAFVAYQRGNITTVGVLCLLAAAIVFALTQN